MGASSIRTVSTSVLMGARLREGKGQETFKIPIELHIHGFIIQYLNIEYSLV